MPVCADREQRHAANLCEPFIERVANTVEEGARAFGNIPFVDRDHQGTPFFEHHVGDAKILRFEPARGIEQQHDDLGEIDRTPRVSHRQLLELVDDLSLLAHAGGVDQADFAILAAARIVPFPVDRDRIARDPGLRAGQQAIFAEQAVDQGRLARVGTADDGELERPCKQRFLVFFIDLGLDLRRFGLRADDRPEVVEQIGDAFAVFGADRRGFAETEQLSKMPASPWLPSALLATNMTGTACSRSQRAISSSSGVSPIRNRTRTWPHRHLRG